MVKISKEAALAYHEDGRPGKIEVKPTKAYRTQTDLSLAYSPGVAFPCLEIQENPDDAYKYTDKGNLVAVISNGTAVLGLGDIGAMSGKPVMEGKGLLFKIYGGIDVFDIEVDEKDPVKFCEAVEKIAPTFGGINLEDIKAPECFYIEERLKKTLDIPVMHDDQHGTAIISAAGLKNALEVAKKDIKDVRIVVNGAGAAAISCTKLYMALGARKENILMLDSKGVITSDRDNLNEQKRFFATDRRDVHTLAEAINGAGFPGYAFAILKSGLCGNPDWVPTERTRYDVDEMAYYALEGGQRKNFTSADDRLDSYIQRAVTDGVIFSEDPDTIAKQLKTYLADNDITFGQDTISLCPWPSESFNSNLVCNHISKRETQEAKNYSFFTFQTEKNYLRGTSTSYNSYIGNTDKQIGNSYHSDLFNNDLLTTGIHTRGCGRIKPWESQTTFNYVNQINKMLAADGEAPMTKKEIYADENLDKVQQAIAHLILDELALETAFEGNRFYDLVCYSRFLGGTKGVNAVADMIANRGGSLDNALKTRLQDQNNWYFKLPAK